MTIQWPNGQMHRMTILYRTDAPRPKARCSMLQQGVRLRDAGRGMSWLTYWRPYDLAMLSNVVHSKGVHMIVHMFPSGFPLERFASKFSIFFFRCGHRWDDIRFPMTSSAPRFQASHSLSAHLLAVAKMTNVLSRSIRGTSLADQVYQVYQVQYSTEDGNSPL